MRTRAVLNRTPRKLERSCAATGNDRSPMSPMTGTVRLEPARTLSPAEAELARQAHELWFVCVRQVQQRGSAARSGSPPQETHDARGHAVPEEVRSAARPRDRGRDALPLATVRKRLAELSATGDVVICQLTRDEGSKTIEAWQCRVSGFVPAPAPGREAEGGVVTECGGCRSALRSSAQARADRALGAESVGASSLWHRPNGRTARFTRRWFAYVAKRRRRCQFPGSCPVWPGQLLPFAVAAEFSGKRSFARAHRSGGGRGSPRRLRLHGRRPFARNGNLVHRALTLTAIGITSAPSARSSTRSAGPRRFPGPKPQARLTRPPCHPYTPGPSLQPRCPSHAGRTSTKTRRNGGSAGCVALITPARTSRHPLWRHRAATLGPPFPGRAA